MTAITVADPTSQYRCEFCQRDFRRESTMLVHMCEQKRRHREQHEIGPKLGFQAYLLFYSTMQGSSALKTWQDFVTSAYYRAFVRFGRHCQDIGAINFDALARWLIKNNIKLDHWCRDQFYTQYLQQHVRQENVSDALTRAIECSMLWQERTGNPSADYLRYGNDNTICHNIVNGRITAWAVYNCESGQAFLSRINDEHISLIWDWIDSDAWQRRFRDYPADQAYAQEILRQAGW